MMNSIIDFHNDFMMILIFVFLFTLTFISAAFYNYSTFKVSEFNAICAPASRVNHDTNLEIMFTTVPTIIIGATIVPSFVLLYDNSD